MNREDLLLVLGALAYLGILLALAYMAVFQGDHDAQTALIALASPGAAVAGVVGSRRLVTGDTGALPQTPGGLGVEPPVSSGASGTR